MQDKMLSFRSSIVARVYAMKAADAMWFIYPLQTIMFGDRGGVDATGIGFLIGIGTLLTIAFEIPTGVIADKISRKHSLVFSRIALSLQIIFWLLWPSFVGYLIGVVFFAFAYALDSGAMQAYLYSVLPKKRKKQFGKVWAQVNGLDLFVFGTATTLITLVGVQYELVLWMTLAAALTSLLISLTLPTDDLRTAQEVEKPAIFKSAIQHIRRSPALSKLLIGGIIMVALASYVNEYLALYYSQVGVETRWLPALFGLGSIIGGLMFWTLHLWEDFLNRYAVVLTVLTMIIFGLSFTGGAAVGVIGYYTVLRLVRILQVQFDSNVQHLSNEEARATISSIASFIAKTIAGLVSITIGILAVNELVLAPLRYSIFIGAAIYLLIQLAIRQNGRRKSNQY